jgi:hypothetical protein
VPNSTQPSTITAVAKWLGAPLGVRTTSTTRAKDSDRQDTSAILDNAQNDGELSMAEPRERVSAATNAATLGDRQALVADLQVDGAPVHLRVAKSPPKFGGWAILAAACVVSVLLGVRIGLGLYGNTGSPLDFATSREDPGAKPDGIAPVVLTPPTQLYSPGGLAGLMEQTRNRFGDATGFRLVVYPTYDLLDRPDPSDGRRVLAYDYRGGWGDPTSFPKSAADGPVAVDLSKFDIAATVGVMRGAPETLHMKQSDVQTMYLIVEPGTDPTTPGALSLSVYVSSDYGGGSIVFAGDGTPKRLDLPT